MSRGKTHGRKSRTVKKQDERSESRRNRQSSITPLDSGTEEIELNQDKEKLVSSKNVVAAGSLLLAILQLIIGCQQVRISQMQSELSERYVRIATYSNKLTHRTVLVSGSDEDISGAKCTVGAEEGAATVNLVYQSEEIDNEAIEGPAIQVEPYTGGIFKVYAIIYNKGVIASIREAELQGMNSNIGSLYDASDLIAVFNEYSVPIIGTGVSEETKGKKYGTLYLAIEDFQGNRDLEMVIFEYDEEEEALTAEVCTELDLLYAYNNNSSYAQARSPYFSNQIQEYGELLKLLDAL